MNVETTSFAGLRLIRPRTFGDARGFFRETFRAAQYAAAGIPGPFVQDNHSRSSAGVLRGLHYQLDFPQGKLVSVVRGEIFDVSVDLRRRSPTFGKWFGATLTEMGGEQVYVPPGFAHGFFTLSTLADVVYKCTEVYHPEDEHTLLWNDPALAINWPSGERRLSEKDTRGLTLAQAAVFESDPR